MFRELIESAFAPHVNIIVEMAEAIIQVERPKVYSIS
jgi:hypothetical protein